MIIYLFIFKRFFFSLAAADIEGNRGAARDTAESADRSRKNNSGTEDGGVNKVHIDPIFIAGGRAIYYIINSFFS